MLKPSARSEFKPPLFRDVAAARASYLGDTQAVLKEAMKLCRGEEFVLLLKDTKEIEGRLLPAYVNALIRQNEGAMHSNSLSLEIMLFVAGTMNIGNAVEKVGIKSESSFIVFASSSKLLKKATLAFKPKAVKELKLDLDPNTSATVALTAIKEDK